MSNSIKSLFDWGRTQLTEQALKTQETALETVQLDRETNLQDAAVDVRYLLCHFLDKTASFLMTWPEKIVDIEVEQQFKAAIAERIAGKPIAYILGYREFWDLKLKVSEATLIPRADTELVIEQALELYADAQQPAQILDLGTGTGAIALALASEFSQAQVIGSDKVIAAVDLASSNAEFNDITNAQFVDGHWFQPFVGRSFDLIVSNPPYIDPKDPHLEQGDLRFEPSSALISDNFGLADLEYLIENASLHLNIGGWLILEHGYDQACILRSLFEKAGYDSVQTRKDYGDNERITFGKRVK